MSLGAPHSCDFRGQQINFKDQQLYGYRSFDERNMRSCVLLSCFEAWLDRINCTCMTALKLIIIEGSQLRSLDIRKTINLEVLRAARSALSTIVARRQYALRELELDGSLMRFVQLWEMPCLQSLKMQGFIGHADFRQHDALKVLVHDADQVCML